MSTLIIIRGNSGSGKSTVARALRERLIGQGVKAALVEQDYLRRIVLKEKDWEYGDNIALIEQTARFALEHGYTVVLEGILGFKRYGDMLQRLSDTAAQTLPYYFNVPFEETLRRHALKPNNQDFGEKEMREWWKEMDLTGFPNEKILSADLSAEEIVNVIIEDIQKTLPA